MANTMFSHPAPNTSSIEHSRVVVHGDTCRRRHTWRASSTAVTCSANVGSRNGQYDSMPNTFWTSRYTRIGGVIQ